MMNDDREPSGTSAAEAAPAGDDRHLPDLLHYLYAARGLDLHGYKPNSLIRRIRKRMSAVGIETLPAYREHLETNQEELSHLLSTILINVTSFFRDPPAWDALAGLALPTILERKPPGEQIRVWSAGCASGEEAYSIAILFAEQLGVEGLLSRVKIYATDVDEDALHAARQAGYSQQQVSGVPAELLERYFERVNGMHLVRAPLRRQVIFGGHDLINDAPISRVDLLLCRNTLMYFNAEAQERVLSRFHFAVRDGGFLLLGRAETIMGHDDAFTPVDPKRRLFARGPAAFRRGPSDRR